MTSSGDYALRGGREGRERLRVLARTLLPTTSAFLDGLGIREGMTCLDVGCGGGDVTVELAQRVGPIGTVLGVDIDETKVRMARQEAHSAGLRNVEFRTMDIRVHRGPDQNDLVYARFLLTHLREPEDAIGRLRGLVRPGGILAVEDIDFSGSFTWPESAAYRRYHELYCSVVRGRGGDPEIGKRLPSLLVDEGLENVSMNIVQPAGTRGEAKLLNPMTMESIAGAVMRDGLASSEEIESVVADLYRFAEDPGSVAGLPRIVQAWGRRPVD